MSYLLQACDDPFHPVWRTMARIDLERGRIDADVEFPALPQLREWVRDGIVLIEDERTTRRLPPDDARFVDLLQRRLGFSWRLVKDQ